MRTTIALDSPTRDKLLDLRRRWHVRSVQAVVARLLEGSSPTAQALYQQHKAAVDRVLKRRKIRRLVAFGSRARGDARPDSDLDLAGEVPRDTDLFDMVHIEDELAAAFECPVHFVLMRGPLNRLQQRIRDEGVALVGG